MDNRPEREGRRGSVDAPKSFGMRVPGQGIEPDGLLGHGILSAGSHRVSPVFMRLFCDLSQIQTTRVP